MDRKPCFRKHLANLWKKFINWRPWSNVRWAGFQPKQFDKGDDMPINRRDFLGSFGAASIVAAVPTATHASAPPEPLNETWDTTWVERVKGKYRAVFDSPSFSDGAALFRTAFWSRDYKDVYGTAAADMTAVLVVRHQGIWLAMNDEFWRKYSVGKRQKFKDSEKKQWYERNPIATAASGGPIDVSISKFINDGNIVLACHLAFNEVIEVVRKESSSTKEDAEKTARCYILPGVILQPSGVF